MLKRVDGARFAKPLMEAIIDPQENPFSDVHSMQYGLEPGGAEEPTGGDATVYPDMTPSAPPPSQGHLRGTAADLLRRNEEKRRADAKPVEQPLSPRTLHLRGSLSKHVQDDLASAQITHDVPHRLDTDVAQDADAHDAEFADSRSHVDEQDRLDMFDVMLQSHDKQLHHLNLVVQTLENKVAYILGQPMPNQSSSNQASIKKNRYKMKAASTPGSISPQRVSPGESPPMAYSIGSPPPVGTLDSDDDDEDEHAPAMGAPSP